MSYICHYKYKNQNITKKYIIKHRKFIYYIRNVYISVIMVVFDLANLISLGHCEQWLNEAAQSNTQPCHIFLIGTKRDLLVIA